MIQAFAKMFKNRPDVFLVLNGRYAEKEYFEKLEETIDLLDLRNVSLKTIPLEWDEYVKAFSRFDCFLNPSKGEGFSIQAREALAMGMPTIVTDNTAQSTVCQTGYGYTISSDKAIPAYYYNLKGWEDTIGEQFECSVDDLADAMKEIYDHYEIYAEKAMNARQWIEGYKYDNLKHFYETLVLPKKVILSDVNEVKEDTLYTSSKKLLKKYQTLLEEQTLFRKIMNNLIILRYQ